MRNGFPLATIAQFQYNWRDAGQYDRQISYKEAEANARRAAACVNALEGFDIAAIEAGVVKQLVEALTSARKIIAEIDSYQKDPNRGDWGVECACCMGELLDDDRRAIADMDAALALIAPSQELQEQG
jgi:hypothetical protein